MMQSVIEFAGRGGKVFGVCNGFQILCESQLLPGALLRNAQQQFVCSNTFLRDAAGKVYKIPVAHGEGRYHATEELLDTLEANGQILFRYCEEDGTVTEQSCPNGSSRNIAGICNATRNVFGMMPHPERACSSVLGNTDGRAIIADLLMSPSLQLV
jgi:phosphoribosylformylglycinamidine synthase